MAQFYKILKADKLGEPWTSHGKTNQTWWCQVEGVDQDVSIGKQVGNDLVPGMHVYGDLMVAVSQKGTNYFKFKGSQVPEGVQRPADTPQQATAQQAVDMTGQMPGWFVPVANQIQYIHDQMKAMDSSEPEPVVEPAKPAEVEDLGGEPLEPEQKELLDGIFGGDQPEPEGK